MTPVQGPLTEHAANAVAEYIETAEAESTRWPTLYATVVLALNDRQNDISRAAVNQMLDGHIKPAEQLAWWAVGLDREINDARIAAIA
jgi:hypothetical protein